MKTIYDWLCELPEPLNEMAINEHLSQDDEFYVYWDLQPISLSIALANAFYWQGAEMGHDFWERVYEELVYLSRLSIHGNPTNNKVENLEWIER